MTTKLEELMLYVAHKCHDDEHFGATKLNKILFFSDFFAFAVLGESITGATYVHLERGPAPKELLPARQRLLERGDARIEERKYWGLTQHRLVPLRNANLADFTPDQIRLVADTIHFLEGQNATQVSDITHKLRPWLDTVEGEEIPYATAFVLTDTPVTRDDKEWAIGKIQELQAAGHVQ